jgi:HEPN domain-containing protein
MTPDHHEWIQKAEYDFGTASREALVVDFPNYDAVCFHCQQCVEKYLKAALVKAGLEVPKIHDLLRLAEMVTPVLPEIKVYEGDVDDLTDYAGNARYPGISSTMDDVVKSIETMKVVRQLLRKHLLE